MLHEENQFIIISQMSTDDSIFCTLHFYVVWVLMWVNFLAEPDCRVIISKLIVHKPFPLLHREHGTGHWRSWNCCDRRTRFVVIWKHFSFILSTVTRIRIDSVMRPRSTSRGRNTSASVTVTVTNEEFVVVAVVTCSILLLLLTGGLDGHIRLWDVSERAGHVLQ